MQLILKQEADKGQHNLLTISEITTFILNEYEDSSCKDIVFIQHLNDNILFSFKIILYTHNVYTLSHYILMFLHNDAE